MDGESEDLSKKAKEHSEKLSKLGLELSKIQFSYKVEHKPSKNYWQKRIKDFERYKKTGLEYYNQSYNLMSVISKNESELFLLRISKFHQLGSELIKIMKNIEENPSIMDSKDKHQSQWSKKIRKEITECSDKCLNHEKEMNFLFREFYEKQLKKILE
ncbi:MAG: hypothetical protein ACR2LL_01135 [Nitrosopumilus sp.]|uniref:hypothetical protein n=1 Tax=Nitrosopumilus sp. TaxID=2024843 RepID=UPI00292D44DF|nr:hypothetical protein [Nitrosopumilus sp.]